MSQVPATQDPQAGAIAPYDPDQYDSGLEDFDLSKDAVMPRLSIVHDRAIFKDSLSGEEFNEIEVILLGLVKGRVLWDDDVKDDAKPMCKSYNFTQGIPDIAQFPWQSSGFDPTAFQGEEVITLPCDGCALKEWGSHPKRDNAPWCGEQHTFPLLLNVGNEEMEAWAPALLTVQRTALKNSRAYLSAFARTRTPLFTVRTHLSLRAQQRGTVKWATPEFKKLGPTDQSLWPEYSQQYTAIREFVTTPRVRDDDDAASTGAQAPQNQAATPPAAPAPAPAAATTPAQPAPAAPAPAAAQAGDLPF